MSCIYSPSFHPYFHWQMKIHENFDEQEIITRALCIRNWDLEEIKLNWILELLTTLDVQYNLLTDEGQIRTSCRYKKKLYYCVCIFMADHDSSIFCKLTGCSNILCAPQRLSCRERLLLSSQLLTRESVVDIKGINTIDECYYFL